MVTQVNLHTGSLKHRIETRTNQHWAETFLPLFNKQGSTPNSQEIASSLRLSRVVALTEEMQKAEANKEPNKLLALTKRLAEYLPFGKANVHAI